MNACLYRKAARDCRRLGYTFTAVAAIFAAGMMGCLFFRGAFITIAFAVLSVFFGFIAANCFGDANTAEAIADEWENRSDHDPIEL